MCAHHTFTCRNAQILQPNASGSLHLHLQSMRSTTRTCFRFQWGRVFTLYTHWDNMNLMCKVACALFSAQTRKAWRLGTQSAVPPVQRYWRRQGPWQPPHGADMPLGTLYPAQWLRSNPRGPLCAGPGLAWRLHGCSAALPSGPPDLAAPPPGPPCTPLLRACGRPAGRARFRPAHRKLRECGSNHQQQLSLPFLVPLTPSAGKHTSMPERKSGPPQSEKH